MRRTPIGDPERRPPRLGERLNDAWVYIGELLAIDAHTGAVGSISDGAVDPRLGTISTETLAAMPSAESDDRAAWRRWCARARAEIEPRTIWGVEFPPPSLPDLPE